MPPAIRVTGRGTLPPGVESDVGTGSAPRPTVGVDPTTGRFTRLPEPDTSDVSAHLAANAANNQGYVTAMLTSGLFRGPGGRFVSNQNYEGARTSMGGGPEMREQVELLRRIEQIDRQMLMVQTRAESFSYPRALGPIGMPPTPQPWASAAFGPSAGSIPAFLAGGGGGRAGVRAGYGGGGWGGGYGAGGPPGPPGGGGGGFGGGGFGDGGGYGHVPFAGAVGVGALSRGLTGGFTAGIAGLAIEELALLPQHATNLTSTLANAGGPRIDLIRSTSAFGRTGAGSGRGLRSLLGGETTGRSPDWMTTLGLDANTAMDMLSRFGVLPQGNEEAAGLIQSLARLPYQGNLSRLPAGQVMGSMSLGAQFGLAQPTQQGAAQYGQQLEEIMTRANREGLNQSEVLRSIDASVAVSAQRGGVGSPTGFYNFAETFARAAGGRAPIMAEQAMTGIEGAARSIGTDPMRTVIAGSAAFRINSESDLARHFSSPEAFQKWRSDPVNQQLFHDFLATKNVNPVMALTTIFPAMFRGSPEGNEALANINASSPLVRSAVGGNGILAGYAGGNVNNIDPRTIAAGRAGQAGGAAAPMTSQGRAGAKSIYNEFIRQGSSPQEAMAWTINAMRESKGIIGAVNPTSGAGGLFQILGDKPGWERNRFMQMFPGVRPENATMEQQIAFARQRSAQLGGLNTSYDVLTKFERSGNIASDNVKNQAIARDLAGPRRGDTQDVPGGGGELDQINKNISVTEQLKIRTGALTISEASEIIPRFNTAVRGMVDVLQSTHDRLETILNSMPGTGGGGIGPVIPPM